MSLFKYMNEDRVEDILIKNKIRFTQPSVFNDPFELKLSMKGFAQESELIKQHNEEFENIVRDLYDKDYSYLKNKYSFEDFLSKIDKKSGLKDFISISTSDVIHENFKKKFDEVMNNTLGILSLTTNPDNLLMWAHYANEHRGFVIELDEKHNFFKSKEENNYIYNGIQKVNYSEIRPDKFLKDFEFKDLLLVKSKEWAYENEYRIIQKLEDADEVKSDIYLFKLPRNLVKAVYCGCNMENSKKAKILEILNKEDNFHNVKVYNTTISDKYYKLEFVQVR